MMAVPSPTTVACPECGLVVKAGALDVHLHRDHQLYNFHGTRAPLNDTLAAILAALIRPPSDAEAYALLEMIGGQEYRDRAAGFLAATLSAALGRVKPASLPAACAALAAVIAPRRTARALILTLAAATEAAPRQLALALAARLPAPVEVRVVRAIRPLLGDRHLPAEAQLTAAAALLQSTGTEGPRARRLLKMFIAGRSKVRAVERLQRLAVRSGSFPLLEEYARRVGERIRMSCPRCGIQKRRSDMVPHLWLEHGLILEGQKVHEPWQLIGEWLDAAAPADEATLERCEALVRQVDPTNGLRRLQRLTAVKGSNEEARMTLLAEAIQRRVSLCPHCFEFVPVPREEVPRPMSVWRGRLSVDGYRVEVNEAGLVPHIDVETPAGLHDRQTIPGRRWTRRAALVIVTGPFIVLACALALINFRIAPLPPVLALLATALVLALVARWRVRPIPDPADVAVDHAWSWLAPRLHAEGFALDDSAFLASLALASIGRGRPTARKASLERLLSLTERVVSAGFGGARHLAALRRLAIADAVRQGKDRVTLVVAEVSRCFRGRLPLAFAEGMLEDWREEAGSPGDVARLRVLLCDSAFEAGFEVSDLIEAGETAPSLGAVLGTQDVDGLGQLRLLWSLRPTRPWDRHGAADLVFDLAAEPDEAELLGRYPDLLLRHELPERFGGDMASGTAHLMMCGRGIVVRGSVIPRPPRKVEVVTKRVGSSTGYELLVDEKRLWFNSDPEAVATRIERWCRYYFGEFLPLIADARRWRSPDATAVLRAWGSVRCPDCRRALLPRVGGVGVSLEKPGER